jgi:hypothetical protein
MSSRIIWACLLYGLQSSDGGLLSGVVLGANGLPLPGFGFVAQTSRGPKTVRTDQAGEFRIATKGMLTVLSPLANKKALTLFGSYVSLIYRDGNLEGVPLSIEAVGVLRINVRDPEGGKVPRVVVLATRFERNRILRADWVEPSRSCITDSRGACYIPNSPYGDYVISLIPGDEYQAGVKWPVHVRAGALTDVSITASLVSGNERAPTGSINGLVCGGTARASNEPVRITSLEDGLKRSVRTDEGGAFAVAGLSSGRYELSVSGRSRAPAQLVEGASMEYAGTAVVTGAKSTFAFLSKELDGNDFTRPTGAIGIRFLNGLGRPEDFGSVAAAYGGVLLDYEDAQPCGIFEDLLIIGPVPAGFHKIGVRGGPSTLLHVEPNALVAATIALEGSGGHR